MTVCNNLLEFQYFVHPHAEQNYLKPKVPDLLRFFETLLGRNWNQQYKFPSRERVKLAQSRHMNIVTMINI